MRFRVSLARLLMVAALACGWTGAARANDVVVGQPAPPLVLHTLDGGAISLESLKGQVVIITFWATWCVPCREELPLLSDYAKRHKAQGLAVLGFSLDGPEGIEAVRKVAATLDFPVGLLGSAWAGGYGRVWKMPVSFVIDRKGILRYDGWEDAPDPWTVERLDHLVGPML